MVECRKEEETSRGKDKAEKNGYCERCREMRIEPGFEIDVEVKGEVVSGEEGAGTEGAGNGNGDGGGRDEGNWGEKDRGNEEDQESQPAKRKRTI